jgi:hypothetical protein
MDREVHVLWRGSIFTRKLRGDWLGHNDTGNEASRIEDRSTTVSGLRRRRDLEHGDGATGPFVAPTTPVVGGSSMARAISSAHS